MINIFKSIAIIALSGFLLSSACKEASGHSTDEIVNVGDDYVVGIIKDKKGKEGCGFVIAIDRGGEEQLFIPVEMDEKYQKDGMKVKLKFHTSRIKQEACFKAQPIVIDEIAAI